MDLIKVKCLFLRFSLWGFDAKPALDAQSGIRHLFGLSGGQVKSSQDFSLPVSNYSKTEMICNYWWTSKYVHVSFENFINICIAFVTYNWYQYNWRRLLLKITSYPDLSAQSENVEIVMDDTAAWQHYSTVGGTLLLGGISLQIFLEQENRNISSMLCSVQSLFYHFVD